MEYNYGCLKELEEMTIAKCFINDKTVLIIKRN